MGLSLGVKKGSRINVGEHSVQVREVKPPNLILISVDHGEDFIISDESRTEIFPNVFVQVGSGGKNIGNRIVFEAPLSIAIERLSEII